MFAGHAIVAADCVGMASSLTYPSTLSRPSTKYFLYLYTSFLYSLSLFLHVVEKNNTLNSYYFGFKKYVFCSFFLKVKIIIFSMLISISLGIWLHYFNKLNHYSFIFVQSSMYKILPCLSSVLELYRFMISYYYCWGDYKFWIWVGWCKVYAIIGYCSGGKKVSIDSKSFKYSLGVPCLLFSYLCPFTMF